MIDKDTQLLVKDYFNLDQHDPKTSLMHSKLIAALKQDPRSATEINLEIRALKEMTSAAIFVASRKYNLQIDPKTSKPRCSYSWDPNTLAWIIELQIAEIPKTFVSGRPLIINIQGEFANNNFSPTDVEQCFNARTIAANNFYKDNKDYQTAIAAIEKKFSSECKEIQAQFYTLEQSKLGLEAVLLRLKALQKRYLVELAVAQCKIRKDCRFDAAYNPNREEIIAAVTNLTKQAVNNIADSKRPVLIHVYKQSTSDRHMQYMVNMSESQSDIPSDLRTFPDDQVSNFWKITNQIVHLDQKMHHRGGTELVRRFGNSETFFRSAAISELNTPNQIDDIDKFEEADQSVTTYTEQLVPAEQRIKKQLQALKKLISKISKQQIIDEILDNNSPVTATEFSQSKVNIGFIIMISPTFSLDSGKLIVKAAELGATFKIIAPGKSKAAASTFIIGNERLQLEEMLNCFNAIEAEKMQLSSADIKDIATQVQANTELNEIQRAKLAKLQSKQEIPIIHKNSYINITLNNAITIFGVQVDQGLLDFGKCNQVFNAHGMNKTQRNIKEYITELLPQKPKIASQLQNLFDNPILDDSASWSKNRNKLGAADTAKVNKFLRSLDLSDAERDKLCNIILAYTRIRDFMFAKHTVTSTFFNKSFNAEASPNSRIANGYMVATASAFVLNYELDFVNHMTCKSGKDRTGLFCLLREALLADDNKMLIDNICNALQHSSAKALNACNAPGCRGLQIDADILSGLKELFGEKFHGVDRIETILKQQQSREVGALSKSFNDVDTQITVWLKEHPASIADAVAPQIFTKPISPPKPAPKKVAQQATIEEQYDPGKYLSVAQRKAQLAKLGLQVEDSTSKPTTKKKT